MFQRQSNKLNQRTVSNWECDQGAPSLDKAVGLAHLYGVSLDDLAADEVEVIVADAPPEGSRRRDAHVLRHLEGERCRIYYRTPCDDVMGIIKSASMPDKVRVLSVGDGWLRVEHDLGAGLLRSKKETAVRLIDIDLIDSVLAWPPDDDDEEEPSASEEEAS